MDEIPEKVLRDANNPQSDAFAEWMRELNDFVSDPESYAMDKATANWEKQQSNSSLKP